MGKKRLMKLIITASAIAGGIGFSGNVASATENKVDRETTSELSKSFNQPNTSAVKGKVINVNSSLRVRAAASLESEVIGSLQKGQEISILAEEGTWYKFDFNGRSAYVSKDYVQKEGAVVSGQGEASVTTSKEKSIGQGTVKNVTNTLNVRSGAGTSYGVIGSLRNGDSFQILGKSGDWYNIKKDGLTGYISGQYVQEVSGETNQGNTNSGSTSTPEQSATGQGKVVNVTNTLNIRSGAGTSHGVVGTLRNGDTFTILGKSGSWYHINKDGVTGYVSGEYVQEVSGESNSGNSNSGSTSTPEQSATGQGKVVNVTHTLNIRSGAGTSHGVVGSLRNGDTFTILGKSGSWYHINKDGVTGYVSGEYVQEVSGESNSGNTSTPEQNTSLKGKVVNVTHTLNIRSGAGTSYGVVGSLRNGDTFTIVGKSGSWYHINKDGVTGYVSGEYVQEVSGETNTDNSTSQGTTSPYGQVINITTNLRVRVSPSSSANVLGYLLNNQVVKVKGTTGKWVNIEFNGQNGYVSSDYIKFVDSNNPNSNGSGSSTNATATFNSVLNVMKAHLGSPYVWGGSGEYLTTASLNALKNTYPVQTAAGSYRRAEGFVNQGYRAFDCSGLMQWGYKQVGINIGRSTWDQVENGVAVSLNDLQPGDLLFYSNLQHVGMYIGNGQWIEAPNSSANVRIVSVPWSKIGKARRIL